MLMSTFEFERRLSHNRMRFEEFTPVSTTLPETGLRYEERVVHG